MKPCSKVPFPMPPHIFLWEQLLSEAAQPGAGLLATEGYKNHYIHRYKSRCRYMLLRTSDQDQFAPVYVYVHVCVYVRLYICMCVCVLCTRASKLCINSSSCPNVATCSLPPVCSQGIESLKNEHRPSRPWYDSFTEVLGPPAGIRWLSPFTPPPNSLRNRSMHCV